WWAARDMVEERATLRMAAILLPRGEFSIVIAGLASTAVFAAEIQSITITYVILTTIVASILVRYVAVKPSYS
ncbi:MAG: cation:proton antiporter, partial [Actinomycetales bacterium]